MEQRAGLTELCEFLAQQGLDCERHDHPAVYTCEEAERLVPPLPAAKTKNLFLRDAKGRRHFLVSVGHDKLVDLRALAARLGVSKLSLASPERLAKYLGVEPGAVTLLGVLNDREHAVEVVVDEELWAAPAFQCHPLVNTSTFVLSREGLQTFFRATGHAVKVLAVPSRESP